MNNVFQNLKGKINDFFIFLPQNQYFIVTGVLNLFPTRKTKERKFLYSSEFSEISQKIMKKTWLHMIKGEVYFR